MKWLLIAVLITPQGAVPYTDLFDYSYQCETRLASLKAKFPGTTGTCTYGG